MEKKPKNKRALAILDGDGSEIRNQFILAGLLLTIFEQFKTYVVEQVESFFSHSFKVRENGFISYKRGEELKAIIDEKGEVDSGQHRNKVFRAAMSFFCESKAITQQEFDEIERIYKLRNDIGHDMYRILTDDSMQLVTIEDVNTSYLVYLKITNWWLTEIELPTEPDLSQDDYDKIDLDAVESVETFFLREIMRKTLLGNKPLEDFPDSESNKQ